MQKVLRIGTRDSQLAVWQATLVQRLLRENSVLSELVYIKSEGDVDTVTPLYALGVIGIFTKTLDTALLNNKIDVAVHSMKDVPTQMASGIQQAAVLKRGPHKDILVLHPEHCKSKDINTVSTEVDKYLEEGGHVIATSSVRRIAQWQRRYPNCQIENLRGNVNTRLRKLKESNWLGAIFAAAGLERINLRPENSIDLDWMLPAPAQGAIMVVCRENDDHTLKSCKPLNNEETALCTKIERDFLKGLMGGCSTPISALAEVVNGKVEFKGNVVSADGLHMAEWYEMKPVEDAHDLGLTAAASVLSAGGQAILEALRKKGLTANEEI